MSAPGLIQIITVYANDVFKEIKIMKGKKATQITDIRIKIYSQHIFVIF